jgi:hypothetical protein
MVAHLAGLLLLSQLARAARLSVRLDGEPALSLVDADALLMPEPAVSATPGPRPDVARSHRRARRSPSSGKRVAGPHLASAMKAEPQPPQIDPGPLRSVEAPDSSEHVPDLIPSPVYLPPDVAKSLRLYDPFPKIPELLRRRGAVHATVVDICVCDRGTVSNVRLSSGTTTPLAQTLAEAIRTWRYRPLVRNGMPAPFCHTIHITYRVD